MRCHHLWVAAAFRNYEIKPKFLTNFAWNKAVFIYLFKGPGKPLTWENPLCLQVALGHSGF